MFKLKGLKKVKDLKNVNLKDEATMNMLSNEAILKEYGIVIPDPQ